MSLRRLCSPPIAAGLLAVLFVCATGCDGLFEDLDDIEFEDSNDHTNGENDNQNNHVAGECLDDADDFSGGDGSPGDPYRICDHRDLNNIGDDERFMEAHFRLHSDIELGGTFEGIGSPDFRDVEGMEDVHEEFGIDPGNPFRGHFDGNGYTVDGLRSTDQHLAAAMFPHLGRQGEITDLTITDADVEGTFGAGILVGYNEGSIANCHVFGRVDKIDEPGLGIMSGGLAGMNASRGEILDSTADADVTGLTLIGGLTGANDGEVHDSSATGDVDAVGDIDFTDHDMSIRLAGGLTGANNGLIAGSSAAGDVWTQGEVSGPNVHELVGGLVGANGPTGFIEESAAIGDVAVESTTDLDVTVGFGSITVGGLVGSNSGTIEDCYARPDSRISGSRSESGFDSVGGLVGAQSVDDDDNATPDAPTITRCYSLGVVNGLNELVGSRAGGLVGTNHHETPTVQPEVESSYWDTDTSRIDDSEGGERLETGDFAREDTFSNDWDFANTWFIADDRNGDPRPLLRRLSHN